MPLREWAFWIGLEIVLVGALYYWVGWSWE